MAEQLGERSKSAHEDPNFRKTGQLESDNLKASDEEEEDDELVQIF